MKTESIDANGNGERRYNGHVVFYHPNGKGTGSAASFELRLNRDGEEGYDCFFLEMADQKSTKQAGSNATFDWANKITVKLGFMDVCEFLTVLEGKADSVGGARKSLYHQTNGSNTLIGLTARKEGGGYFLGLSKRSKGQDGQKRISLCLSEVEATGLRQVLQTGLFFMSFHSSLFFS